MDCVTRRSLLRILLFGHDGRCVFVFVLIFWPTIIIKDVLKCLEFLMTIVPVITRTGNSFTSSNFIRITLNVVGLRSFRLRSWPFKNRTWYSMITITRTIYGRAIFTVRGWSVKISLCLLLGLPDATSRNDLKWLSLITKGTLGHYLGSSRSSGLVLLFGIA